MRWFRRRRCHHEYEKVATYYLRPHDCFVHILLCRVCGAQTLIESR
jgi:hypothetical protein